MVKKETNHQIKSMSVWLRWLLLSVGALSLVLGIVGIFLPVLPTTPFILLTAACWSKASPRFHIWLSHHKTFGPIVSNWAERRAVPQKAKWLAWCMMILSCLFVGWHLSDWPWLVAGMVATCLAVGVWLWRLPNA